ncbi:MAG: lytic murein transglycosylase, partial [Actinomycetota bacterium]|nr:lytic murein transglycosylase [Actinomycetota bacterium]
MSALPWSAASADPAHAARARLLGATSPHALGFALEHFEYVVAGEHIGLVRVQGAWVRRPAAEPGCPQLVVSHPGGTLRPAALPDPMGWSVRGPTGEWRWHLGFAVELRVLVDDRSAFALDTGGDLLIGLPDVHKRELCDPRLLEVVTRRRGRPLSLVGVGLAIAALVPMSLAPMSLAPGSLAGEETAAAQGGPVPGAPTSSASAAAGAPVAPPCPPTGLLPDGTHCTPGDQTPAPGATGPAPAPELSPVPPPPPGSSPPLTPTPPAAASPHPDKPAKPQHKPTQPVLHSQENGRTPAAGGPVRLKPRPRTRPTSHRAKPTPPKAKPNLARSNATPWTLTPPSSSISTFTAPAAVPNFLLDSFRIPPFLLPIYQAAGTEYGIPWQLLAAINEIETDYGRNLSVSSAGALGWMQFISSSWQAFGVDANGDRTKDPYNPVDAIFAAARYLRAAGGDRDINKAVFAYNHADWYVQSVMLRARLISAIPADLIGSLTGLTQGRFPVGARARYADGLDEKRATRRVRSLNAAVAVNAKPGRREVNIFARSGAPVVAVNDGIIRRVGRNRTRGRYVVLEDVYGNRYTYAHLGKVARSYPAPKQPALEPSEGQLKTDRELPIKDAAPTQAASAGRHARMASPRPAVPWWSDIPSGRTVTTSRLARIASPRPAVPWWSVPPRRETPETASRRETPETASRSSQPSKERLFAHPGRSSAYRAGGDQQLLGSGRPVAGYDTFDSYVGKVLGLKRSDVSFKALKPGAQVIAGTILGRIDRTDNQLAPHVGFSLRPTGRGAPQVDPKPILDGWKLLEATAVYRASDKNPFWGRDAKSPSIGQILLMSKAQLEKRVLSDPRIEIYDCGKSDIQAHIIDHRVLALMEFLAASGLRPYVSTLKCGHSLYIAGGGAISEHSYGDAVDIAKINGIPIIGHQGPGSITDITNRRIMTLQGTMQPNQLISLMQYAGVPYAWAQGDHADHIHIGYPPLFGDNNKLRQHYNSILKPNQ